MKMAGVIMASGASLHWGHCAPCAVAFGAVALGALGVLIWMIRNL